MATPTHGPFAGAYFSSVSVANLRCFAEEQTLTLHTPSGHPAHWTLLIGENGTGKTTLLHAIAAVSLQPERLNPDRSSEGDFTPRGFLTRPAIHREHFPGDTDTFVSARLTFSPALRARPARTVETSLVLRDPGLGLPDEVSSESYERIWPAFVAHCFGYGPQRRLATGALSAEVSDPLAPLFNTEVPLINAEEWYLQRDYASANPRNSPHDRERAGRARDRVTALLKRVLPDVANLEPVTLDPVRGLTRLIAHTPYGHVPVSELGFGYQTTLAWVVDLAVRMMAAYPESEDPLAEPAVVLIDEIDLHLHPKWQRTLLAELSARFPNVQFIATAHSPLIVQAAPDANIVVLRREGDHVVIDPQPHSVRPWRVDQILTSDLFGLPSARDPSLDPLLARRDAILAKPALTADDEAELVRLRAEIGELPGGETPWEMEAMEVIRRAAQSIKGDEQAAAGGVRDGGVMPYKATAVKTKKRPGPKEAKNSRAKKSPESGRRG